MTRRLLLATTFALAAAAGGCSLGGHETTTTAGAACISVGGACGQNADCCSYGCQGGICAPNPVDGGACRTTDDCALSRLCKSGACTTPTAGMCRDDADVCASDYSCCSGNCVGYAYPTEGRCQPNHAPVAAFTVAAMDANGNVPYHALLTLQNASTDADGDGLQYVWSLVSAPPGSLAVLSSATAASPTLTADVVGDYAVQLTVTDGPSGQPGRLTSSTSRVLHAVNVPPAVSAGADRTASRNVPLSLSGTATDSDGDALTCTWRATPPGGGADVVLAGPSPCNGAFGATFTCSGTYTYPNAPASEGVWTVSLAATDGPNAVAATAHVTCANDPPAANAGVDEVWNLGATAPQNPTVALTGAFVDPNADAAWSWQWVLASAPAGSALVPGTLLSDAQAASFVPDVAGRYVVQLQVCDRPSSCGTDTANVDVYRHIQEFGDGRVVNASDYAHGANRIAMAGPDPATPGGGKLWLRDPTGTAAEISASLDGVPDAIAVTPAGDWAIAGNSLWLWVVKLSVTPPTVARVSNAAGALGSIALAGTEALVFPQSSSYFYHFAYTTATSATVLTNAYFFGNVGRVDPAGANLYVLETGYSPRVTRYLVNKQGGFSLTSYTTAYLPYGTSPSDLWVSGDGTHLFLGTGDIYAASSLTSSTPATLGLSPWWVDSLSDGRAAALAPDRLALFNTGLTHTTDDLLPRWGVAGVGYSAIPDGGFLRIDPLDAQKTIRYVLVHASGTAQVKSGFVTFP